MTNSVLYVRGRKMTKLRTKIVKYLIWITVVMMVLIWAAMLVLQVYSVTERTFSAAEEIFFQIRRILELNKEDLEKVQRIYSETSLANAETVAYIIQNNPEMLESNDVEEIIKVAQLLQIDEIHIFDQDGVIIYGTEPQYYGYSFDSGEQLKFFKPLLEDHSLRLVQDISPNTAEGRMVQYSALWSENGEFIVEVGMYPESILAAREKNELSYIFSLLKANAGVSLYAIDEKTGKILGSTNSFLVGKHQDEIGLTTALTNKKDKGFFCSVNGVFSYVVITEEEGVLIGYVLPVNVMYEGTLHTCIYFAVGLLLIAGVLVFAIYRYLKSFVLVGIQTINKDLASITNGDLDVFVNVQNSQEFSELSLHINDMVYSLVESRRQIEKDRDMDLLTGLYNRRGLDNELYKLEKKKESLGHYAAVMIDADKLKTVNDVYGHENGDIYLCRIAELLAHCGQREQISARQGGDEFVVFLYGYEQEELLDAALDELKSRQNGKKAELKDGIIVELAFSLGFCKGSGELDYETLLKKADARMYENKRLRKGDSCMR